VVSSAELFSMTDVNFVIIWEIKLV